MNCGPALRFASGHCNALTDKPLTRCHAIPVKFAHELSFGQFRELFSTLSLWKFSNLPNLRGQELGIPNDRLACVSIMLSLSTGLHPLIWHPVVLTAIWLEPVAAPKMQQNEDAHKLQKLTVRHSLQQRCGCARHVSFVCQGFQCSCTAFDMSSSSLPETHDTRSAERCPPETADAPKMSCAMRKPMGSGCGGHFKQSKKSKHCLPVGHRLCSDMPGDDATTVAEEVDNSAAPKASCSTVENQPFIDLIADNCVCRHCGGRLELKFKSIGLATTQLLSCSGCKLMCASDIERTTLLRGKHPRTSDFSVKCQCVAACVASGDGGSEAARMLGLLDLPNCPVMEKFAFPKVEFTVSGNLQEASKDALVDNLREEVRLAVLDEPDANHGDWLHATETWIDLEPHLHARMKGGADTAWQKRSSGRRHDSPSGHEFVIGARTRKPMSMCMKSKFCRMCSLLAKSKGVVPRNHQCVINHADSSGSMEADALVDMVHKLDSKWKVHLSHVCADDDSAMGARLHWNNNDHKAKHGDFPKAQMQKGKDKGKWRVRNDTGKLWPSTPEPLSVADPAHRKKTLRNRLCSFNNLTKKRKHGFGPADITRIAKNFSCFVNTSNKLDHSQWEAKAKCVLDLHFDCHDNCGDFCLRKRDLLDKTPEENKKKFCRSMDKDAVLCEMLSEIVGDFATQQRSDEVGHGMDTQANEALNNTIAWKAPKGKTHSGSTSLENRVCVAVSTHLIAPEECLQTLFMSLGMTPRLGAAHCLRLQTNALES